MQLNDYFIEYLKKKGLRFTKQRETILAVFAAANKHLSVDELYDIVAKKDCSIGHATVFRTMKLMLEAGIAAENDFGDKISRFELSYGDEHHDHLICIKCGKYIETVDEEIEELQEKLCKKYKFKLLRHKMQLFGYCEKCS